MANPIKKIMEKIVKQKPVVNQRKFLFDGAINVVWFDTCKELSAYMHKKYPKSHSKHGLIYGEFIPTNQYIYFGTLYLARESSVGLIAHEVYHAIRHIVRAKDEKVEWNVKTLEPTDEGMRREERHANMFGQLLNQLLEDKEKNQHYHNMKGSK